MMGGDPYKTYRLWEIKI